MVTHSRAGGVYIVLRCIQLNSIRLLKVCFINDRMKKRLERKPGVTVQVLVVPRIKYVVYDIHSLQGHAGTQARIMGKTRTRWGGCAPWWALDIKVTPMPTRALGK